MSTEEQLRCFALAILERLDGIDQSDVEAAWVEYGLLEVRTPAVPCGEFCACAECYSAQDFTKGEVRCYRVAEWVKYMAV